MRRMYGVGVLLLALGMFASPLQAQGAPGQQDRPGGLKLNYPNPFNPETRIVFELPAGLFEAGKPVFVTVRVFNLLQQFVATPTALNHPAGNRTPIERLQYTAPGEHVAYWDGLNKDGREVASGRYYVLLEVNGRPLGPPLRISVAK